MLFALALIPVIGLLAFIYFNDKNEREPFGFLISLFFMGCGTVVSAIILETVGMLILNLIIPDDTILKGYILAILIVGPAEEFGKFLVLRLRTWNSRHFDHTYDAIVYSVFVSLGFAALENIGYVFTNGVGAALLRMFTAVPGHACFAVFMGFFYGKAKLAQVKEKTGKRLLCSGLALLIPIVLHGVYDGILMGGGNTEEVIFTGISVVIWIVYIVAMLAVSVVVVIISSRRDICFVKPTYEAPLVCPDNQPVVLSAYQQPNQQQVTYQTAYQRPVQQPQQPSVQPAFMNQQQSYQRPVQQPVYQQPIAQQPVYRQQPSATQGVFQGSMMAAAAYQQPQYQPAPVAQPMYQQPQNNYQRPTAQQQAVQPHATQQPFLQQPVLDKPVFKPNVVDTWTCMCGKINSMSFCTQCGKQRPLNDNVWKCPRCGAASDKNFCGNCGFPKPTVSAF